MKRTLFRIILISGLLLIFNSTSYALEIQLPPLEGMESGETDNAWEKPQKKLEIKIVVEAEATIDSSEDASGKR